MRKIKYFLLTFSIMFISYGVYRKEVTMVLKEAINICLECIGVG